MSTVFLALKGGFLVVLLVASELFAMSVFRGYSFLATRPVLKKQRLFCVLCRKSGRVPEELLTFYKNIDIILIERYYI